LIRESGTEEDYGNDFQTGGKVGDAGIIPDKELCMGHDGSQKRQGQVFGNQHVLMTPTCELLGKAGVGRPLNNQNVPSRTQLFGQRSESM
jgi:hypothetical protein